MTTRKSDPRGPFFDWDLERQVAHIRECQKNGLECIRNGEPAQLADIADHLDIWGPWLCDKVEELVDKRKRDAEMLKTAIDALSEIGFHEGAPILDISRNKAVEGFRNN